MSDRKIWAEDFEGQRLSGDDMTQDASVDDMDKVKATAVKGGMQLITNCVHCGRQTMAIVKWGEIVCWLLGRQIPGCTGQPNGVHQVWTCRCSRQNKIIHKWSEVRSYVDEGVGMGMLKPAIYKAAGIGG